MDSDEEFMQFSPDSAEKKQPERKFKRLKKASTLNVPSKSKGLLPTPSSCDNDLLFLDVNSNSSTFEPLETNAEEELGEIDARDEESQSGDFKELDSGFDSSNVEEESSRSAKRTLEFDSVGEGIDLTATEVQLENQNQDLDGMEEKTEKKKKKKKRANRGGDDENENLSSSAASNKRIKAKERRERLKDLRSQSQRLLRESRDASFKPVLFVQKSVSSVLEKIRQRKHQLFEKSVNIDDNDAISREVTLDFDFEFSPQNSPLKDMAGHKITEADSEKRSRGSIDAEGSLSTQGPKQASGISHKNSAPMALAEDSKQTFRAPVDDTQDLIFDSQTSESKDEMLGNPLEAVMAPSLLAMNLKLDSAPPDDFSSDEEDNDKENIDPRMQGLAEDLTSSPKGDPVKAFVDDEAEEEDDSDNDLARFKDNEEDEDFMDSEELNDIIATGYEEKPMDIEVRNELHQRWLEEQDAAGTENLLQRLKCHSKQRDMALIEEEEDEESEEVEEEFLDELAEDLVPRNAVRMNLKKAKEMICQMFTDKNDVYISSDDEETDERLAKQNLSDKSAEQAKFLSPAEDEDSKDLFGLIKKLNAVPDKRRRAKITSHFHTLSIAGNKTASSKSSFLSRKSRNSLPSFQKQGSSTVRSFVFERDDSNSRSAISMSEDSSDVGEKRQKRTASAKYSSSQVRFSAQTTQKVAEKSSGPSLHEILRCQSLQSTHFGHGSMAGQVEAIYASFKLDQNLVKKERGVSIRTA